MPSPTTPFLSTKVRWKPLAGVAAFLCAVGALGLIALSDVAHASTSVAEPVEAPQTYGNWGVPVHRAQGGSGSGTYGNMGSFEGY